MKCPVKAKVVRPLMEVARRYPVNAEFVMFAATYAVLLAIRHSSAKDGSRQMPSDEISPKRALELLSFRLSADYGRGYDASNLRYMR